MSRGRAAAGRRPRGLGPLGAVLVAGFLLLAHPCAAHAQPTVVGTIPFPGGEPFALGVYPPANKVFVTEDNSGRLFAIDATTLGTVGTVDVGGAPVDLVVNETYGKVYVASDKDCCTTGVTPGNGLISVVDAKSNQLITQINPGPQGNVSYFALANDEVHDKIYVAFYSGIGVIDAATDQYTLLYDATNTAFAPTTVAVNTVTNQIYVDWYANNELIVIDGASGAVEHLALDPTGGKGPLSHAVNQVENKVYVTMLQVPGQGQIAILVIDRDTGATRFVGADDLEPLSFNPVTNRLFAGVQVGQRGAIVDGATDALADLDLGGTGIGATGVRESSDNAYFLNGSSTFVANGATRCVARLDTGPSQPRGGLFVEDVAIDQTDGRVYVINDQEAGKVTVIQDAPVTCPAPPGGAGPGGGADDTSVELVVRAKPSQRVLRQRGVKLSMQCPAESCEARAGGYASVPAVPPGLGASRRYRFKRVSRQLAAGERAKVKLRLSKQVRARIRAALAHRRTRRKLRARLSVTATDPAGNRRTRKLTVKLKP